MECNSIPGHPLGFSPSVMDCQLWNVGSKPVFRCQCQKIRIPQAGVLEFSVCCEQHTSSGGSRIPFSVHRLNICTSGGRFCFQFCPRVSKNHHDSQRTESELIERLQHLWNSVIKCPVTNQMAVALVFRGVSFCSVGHSSIKTENRQKGCYRKWQIVTDSILCIWFFLDIFASVQRVIVQAFSFGTVSCWMEEKPWWGGEKGKEKTRI